MPVSIYAVSYERSSAAFYEAVESSFQKMSVTFDPLIFSARTKESGRGAASPLCHNKTDASSLSEALALSVQRSVREASSG